MRNCYCSEGSGPGGSPGTGRQGTRESHSQGSKGRFAVEKGPWADDADSALLARLSPVSRLFPSSTPYPAEALLRLTASGSESGDVVGYGFVIRWKHLKPSASSSLREHMMSPAEARSPIEPLTVPAALPSRMRPQWRGLAKPSNADCSGPVSTTPNRTLQAIVNGQGIKISSLPLSEIQETAVIDECRMTTLRGSKGPSCAVFYPILKHVALLDEILFPPAFLCCLFWRGLASSVCSFWRFRV